MTLLDCASGAVLVIWSSVLLLVVAGLDHRFGWSDMGFMRVRELALLPAAAGYPTSRRPSASSR